MWPLVRRFEHAVLSYKVDERLQRELVDDVVGFKYRTLSLGHEWHD